MRLLLDTRTFLWWVGNSPQLSRRAKAAIAREDHECLLSLASCWEMAIKVSLGKLQIASPLDRFIPEQLAANRFRLLAVQLEHVLRIAALPFHHRDPFDRLVAAQAIAERLVIVSADRVFGRYGLRRIW
jgi:PIN domain nuclease of toxin-antitoxin system